MEFPLQSVRSYAGRHAKNPGATYLHEQATARTYLHSVKRDPEFFALKNSSCVYEPDEGNRYECWVGKEAVSQIEIKE